MSGASSVRRSSRLTKLRVTPSASAISAVDRYLPSSSIRVGAGAPVEGRGFAGAHACANDFRPDATSESERAPKRSVDN